MLFNCTHTEPSESIPIKLKMAAMKPFQSNENTASQNELVVVTATTPTVSPPEPREYVNKAQWLRAAVLGANDGLVSTASLMMGVGAVKPDARTMLLSGLAGLVGGACSMAIGEFVSVCTQLDVELSQINRDKGSDDKNEEGLPNPFQAASASALAFSAGAVVPLLSGAFIEEKWVRIGVVVAASSVALVVFGAVGACLGKSAVVKASVRVLLGGWAAMLVTYGVLRLFAIFGI